MIFKNKLINLVYWIKAWIFLHKHGFWDIHVHTRDKNQWAKFTIAKWKRLAWFYGVRFGAFMPNTDPAITDETTLKRYIEIAEKSGHKNIKYKIWFGLTANVEQIKEFVRLYKKYKGIVLGAKIYFASSTGDLEIVKESDQKLVLKTLAELDYTGPIALHCEENGKMNLKKFIPEKIETWNNARPEESEVYSVSKAIRLIKETNFHGHVHICHVSSHDSVLVINKAFRQGMDISSGATIHHLVFDTEQMAGMSTKKALQLKCNPPVRTISTRKSLLEDVVNGLIDIVESDLAPHTKDDKNIHYASGVNNYKYLPNLIVELRKAGASDQRIIELINIKPREIFLEDKKFTSV
jgi:dihydroorotase